MKNYSCITRMSAICLVFVQYYSYCQTVRLPLYEKQSDFNYSLNFAVNPNMKGLSEGDNMLKLTSVTFEEIILAIMAPSKVTFTNSMPKKWDFELHTSKKINDGLKSDIVTNISDKFNFNVKSYIGTEKVQVLRIANNKLLQIISSELRNTSAGVKTKFENNYIYIYIYTI